MYVCVWGGGLTRVVVICNLQLFHKIVFPKVSLREHYFCYAAGNPNYIMIEEIQRTSYITVTFVIFTPSPPLSGGGDLPYLPLSLSSRLLYPFSLSLPSLSHSLFFLPLPPPISLFSLYTHSFLPSLFFHHTLFLSLLLPTLSLPP